MLVIYGAKDDEALNRKLLKSKKNNNIGLHSCVQILANAGVHVKHLPSSRAIFNKTVLGRVNHRVNKRVNMVKNWSLHNFANTIKQ